MDTTLRDGEQMQGVAYSPVEKLHIATLLLKELKVDRIEVASARVSKGEFEAAKKVAEWAQANNLIDKVEVLGFIDGDKSIEWIRDAGLRVINLLCKGSPLHLEKQLRKTPDQHIDEIRYVIKKAQSLNIDVNLYFEDWSNGILQSPDYIFYLIDALRNAPVKRFMLPDTLGVFNPDRAFDCCKIMTSRYPDLHFDFHAHNDYDLAVANTFAALKAGIKGVHVTVNGLGERAGNTPLASAIAVIHDQLSFRTNIQENKIYKVGKIVESYSGVRVPINKPIVGENSFTQTSGVHADGDSKANLYFNNLLPERFGRKRQYALGKLSGKASVTKNLEELGLELSPDIIKTVTQRVIELGDKKESVTVEDLPFIISDVIGRSNSNSRVCIKNYTLGLTCGMQPMASVQIEIHGDIYQETASGDGQYDAFMKAVKKIYESIGEELPYLVDYFVTIPPGGKTDALVETVISWEHKGRVFKTRGLDADQTESAIKATEKMLNIIENEKNFSNVNKLFQSENE
ncbi:2-isopropylmalate synthase [Tenuifilum thalassicum]|uniref:2-isopropylmalate synthase n=2 Tax=Tenuifilum thalassicum TaxID=2590900 RepID=A0A7D4CSY8_9BACT|nr:2-isopropylmalate synthase [Tenuifilum thalassicum]